MTPATVASNSSAAVLTSRAVLNGISSEVKREASQSQIVIQNVTAYSGAHSKNSVLETASLIQDGNAQRRGLIDETAGRQILPPASPINFNSTQPPSLASYFPELRILTSALTAPGEASTEEPTNESPASTADETSPAENTEETDDADPGNEDTGLSYTGPALSSAALPTPAYLLAYPPPWMDLPPLPKAEVPPILESFTSTLGYRGPMVDTQV